jgi:hypothetical protein
MKFKFFVNAFIRIFNINIGIENIIDVINNLVSIMK